MSSLIHRRYRSLIPLGALVLALGACATNPVTGRREISLISESQEIAMGLEAAKEAANQMGVYPDPQLQRYVSDVGMPMAKGSERPSLPWSFTVIDDPVVNAFALPGGPLFVTRGILAHMNSEAQLASVLGHEIGHVTAKHSVSQMSRVQLAQIGLVGAMIVRPELAPFGELGSSALGLMFLKFGRDDETQADELGFRYMTGQAYDPSEMTEMFRTLARTSGESSDVPEWLSTHPDPGNRVNRTQERIAAWTPPAGPLKTNRDPFLMAIDGMVFGEDPRQGYFQKTTFLQPTLKFRLDFPAEWTTANQPSQVAGISSRQDAIIALTVAGKTSPAQAANEFLRQEGIQASSPSTSPINGLTAAAGRFTAQTEQGILAGYAAFIQLDDTTYRILAYTAQANIAAYDGIFRQTIGSFRRLTDPAALAVKPAVVRLVQIRSAMTISQFQQQYPSSISIEQLAVINGAPAASTSFPAGSWLKRVAAE
jgi:predicted Zn-dependent protease